MDFKDLKKPNKAVAKSVTLNVAVRPAEKAALKFIAAKNNTTLSELFDTNFIQPLLESFYEVHGEKIPG